MKDVSYGIIPYLFNKGGISIMASKCSKKSDVYSFIKGKIDYGETEKECCKREVKEEIGIDIDTYDLEDLFFQKNPKKDVGLYLINWDKYSKYEFQLDTSEIYSLEWFNIRELPNIAKNQRLILTDLLVKFSKMDFHQKI
jgi:8-oxo-dGTP pyrophosphatase MutT (NUDIX family)